MTQEVEQLLEKFDFCVQIARLMLGAWAIDAEIEDQASDLLHLPLEQLDSTYRRLVAVIRRVEAVGREQAN